MLHKKVCIDYCKILENVEVFTPCNFYVNEFFYERILYISSENYNTVNELN